MTLYIYLWWGSQVDDALQLHPGSELFHQEGVPVLVDGPLCCTNTAQLKHVQGKDISDRRQYISGLKNIFTCTGLVSVTIGDIFSVQTLNAFAQRAKASPSYPGVTPVAVDRALINLDGSSIWGEQVSRRWLQLRLHSAHTGIGLKRVWPARRVLVHHLQQVTDCGLRGSLQVLSKKPVQMVRLDCWWGQLWWNRKVHNLWVCRLDVLPHAHWFCHHLPVWTSRLKESGKGRFPNSCIWADKNHIRTENTNNNTKTINPLLTNVTLNGNSFYSASWFLGITRKTLLPCFISHNI